MLVLELLIRNVVNVHTTISIVPIVNKYTLSLYKDTDSYDTIIKLNNNAELNKKNIKWMQQNYDDVVTTNYQIANYYKHVIITNCIINYIAPCDDFFERYSIKKKEYMTYDMDYYNKLIKDRGYTRRFKITRHVQHS